MEMLASMLFEPSSGSIATRNVPSASDATGSSRSSETTARTPAPFEAAHEGLVGEDIERLLRDAVVGRTDRARRARRRDRRGE